MVDLGQGTSHCLRSPLTQFNKKIKMIIIVILKPNLEVDSGQSPGHRLGGSTLIEPGQYNQVNIRIKVVIIIVLKFDSGIDLR